MAMIDYGAIAWKNGKLISTDMFTPMKDMVGWDDSDVKSDAKTDLPLVNNYFAYVGDRDFTLAFYKSGMRLYNPDNTYDNQTVLFGSERFKKWKTWEFFTYTNEELVDIIVKPKRFHDYYVCHMKYNGDKYKVAFGYGVDLEYYKKWHIIDYYGSLSFIIKSKYRDFKYWLKEIQWRWGR